MTPPARSPAVEALIEELRLAVVEPSLYYDTQGRPLAVVPVSAVQALLAEIAAQAQQLAQAEQAVAQLTRELEELRADPLDRCTCDGGPQGEGLVSVPHIPPCPLAEETR